MEVPRKEVREVLPLPTFYSSKYLKKNISAIFNRCGNTIPVIGSLPDPTKSDKQNTWLLLCEDKAYVISGLPTFLEDIKTPKLKLAEPIAASAKEEEVNLSEEEAIAKEIEELEKMLLESA